VRLGQKGNPPVRLYAYDSSGHSVSTGTRFEKWVDALARVLRTTVYTGTGIERVHELGDLVADDWPVTQPSNLTQDELDAIPRYHRDEATGQLVPDVRVEPEQDPFSDAAITWAERNASLDRLDVRRITDDRGVVRGLVLVGANSSTKPLPLQAKDI